MSLPIYVDAYSGYRPNEHPRQFCVDEDVFEIERIEERWREVEAEYFKVRTIDRKTFLLRCSSEGQWTLESAFDGIELLGRPSITLINIEARSIREAESRITGCERCRPEQSEQLFDLILAEVLDRRGPFEFVMSEPARCPSCRGVISEKTLVEPHGGLEVDLELQK
jgi:hypothetical protein